MFDGAQPYAVVIGPLLFTAYRTVRWLTLLRFARVVFNKTGDPACLVYVRGLAQGFERRPNDVDS